MGLKRPTAAQGRCRWLALAVRETREYGIQVILLAPLATPPLGAVMERMSGAPADIVSQLAARGGVSWQVVPKVLPELINDPDSDKSQRAMVAMLRMKKIDIAELKRAYAG